MDVFYCDQMVARAESFSPSAGKPRDVAVMAATLRRSIALSPPEPVTEAQLCMAHEPRYVEAVLACRAENGFGNRLPEVAGSLPWTSGAMLSAARAALEQQTFTVAPVSGFHHASHASGGGYCTFNGLMVAACVVASRPAGPARRHPRFRPALRQRHDRHHQLPGARLGGALFGRIGMGSR